MIDSRMGCWVEHFSARTLVVRPNQLDFYSFFRLFYTYSGVGCSGHSAEKYIRGVRVKRALRSSGEGLGVSEDVRRELCAVCS